MIPPTPQEQRDIELHNRINAKVKTLIGELQVTVATLEARAETSERLCLDLAQENERLKQQLEEMAGRIETSE